ncbi:MAG: ABC transporter permease, partial [Candidatus Omnitrophica bacterium]|nr:ABC transporter permease [Candidatus Omnitrophota bacterium]
MKKVLAISNNTFREAMRKKTLNVLLIFALIIIVSSVFFTYLSPGEEMKIIKDMGLGSIMFFGMLIAVFGASSLIPTEIEKKTISTVITKPVRRMEFVLGKFFG